ncbi:MAG: GGDEF domain-containing protein [Rhodocyclaceae bacterium]|nr:GGDEF domain-containing protein [Rhodocyclaceae bacterium]
MIVDQLASELNRLATLDALTGIGNRRVFYTRAEAELARCRRKSTPLSLLMIDLDRFKAINDALGHAAGDEALRRFASTGRPAPA